MSARSASLVNEKKHCFNWEDCHQRLRARVASRQHSTGCPANHKISASRYPWGKKWEKMCLGMTHLWSFLFWVIWLNCLSRTVLLTYLWNGLFLGWPLSLLLLQSFLPTPASLSVISFLFHSRGLDLCNLAYSVISIHFSSLQATYTNTGNLS